MSESGLALFRRWLVVSHSLRSPPRSFFLIPRSAQSLAGRLAGQFSPVDDQNAVDRHVRNALAVLIRLLEGREIAHGCRVKRDEVGGKPGFDKTSILQAGSLGGERGHLAD